MTPLRADLHALALAYQRAKEASDLKSGITAYETHVSILDAISDALIDNPAALVEIFAPDAGGWRTMESAPRDGSEFLALWKALGAEKPDTVKARYSTQYEQFFGVNCQSLDGFQTIAQLTDGFTGELLATHWRPLPTPPGAAS
jgi:hypothetical protein